MTRRKSISVAPRRSNDTQMVLWSVDVATGAASLVEEAGGPIEAFARQP